MHGSINRQNGNFESKSSKERKIPMFILCKMKNSAPLFKYVYNITITCSPFVPNKGKFPCSDVMSVYFRF